MAVPIVKHRIRTDEYDRMVVAGAFERGARLELIHGEILEMTPIGAGHQAEVDRLNDLFTSRLGRKVIVRIQGPIRVGRFSEPEPDLVLLERRGDYYRDAHPDSSAVHLVIEVADSSLAYDRQVKGELYCQQEVPEYWIVNLVDSLVEVCRRQGAGRPPEWSRFTRGESLFPLAFPDLTLTVDEILG